MYADDLLVRAERTTVPGHGGGEHFALAGTKGDSIVAYALPR